MIYLTGATLLLMLLCVGAAATRTAQLKRMARTLGLRYDVQLDRILLPDSTNQAQFFKRGLHQFFHVLTFCESNAFVRVCEDRIFASPLDKKPLHTYTLVGVELLKDTFPPFVLAPREPGQPICTQLPEDLATRYTLNAPAGYSLPATVIGFLKAHDPCYLECTATALLYCELNTVPVAQIQPLRFRALQLVKELVSKTQGTPQPTAVPTDKLTDAELQAQLLLKLQTAPRSTSQAPSTAGRYLYAALLLILLGGMLGLAAYLLQQAAH